MERSSTPNRSSKPYRLSARGAQMVNKLARAIMHIMSRFFTQIWFKTLPKPKLFRFLPINTSLLIPLGLQIIEIGGITLRSFRDLSFFKKGLLEIKPKVWHHSQSLIQGFDIWILVWRLSSIRRGWSDPWSNWKLLCCKCESSCMYWRVSL